MPRLRQPRAPLFLVEDDDRVLVQMAGFATLEVCGPQVRRIRLAPGHTVPVRARTAIRVIPESAGVVFRLTSARASRDVVTWYCDDCGALVHHREIDAHDSYARVVSDFNADASMRTCGCGAVHPLVDAADPAWADVERALRGE